MVSRTVLLQTVLPAYRMPIARRLHRRSWIILHGRDYFDTSVRTTADPGEVGLPVRNVYLFGRRLLVQVGALRICVSARSVVVELNPRILSTWTVLLIRRLLGRRTVGWGHFGGRGGNQRQRSIRRFMARMCSGVVAYTAREAGMFREHGFDPVFVAPNALTALNDIEARLCRSSQSRFRIVFSGRMVKEKHPDVVLDAFLKCRLDQRLVLTMIGDGAMRSDLEERVPEERLHEVEFTGAVHDPSVLAHYYAEALVAVSPGYVGLSMVQAISHGVPILYERDAPHSPEVDLAIEGVNAYAVPGPHATGWCDAIERCSRGELQLAPREVARTAIDSHNLEAMERGLVAAAE